MSDTLTKQQLADIKLLLQKKYREEQQRFIIEGWKAVREAVDAHAEIDAVLVRDDEQEHEALSKVRRSVKRVFVVSSKQMESLSDAVTAQGVIAVLPFFPSMGTEMAFLKKKDALIVAVDGVADPGNLGTIIRTCDWFGVDAVVLSKGTVELYNPKVVRSTMGSLFHLPIVASTDLPEFLHRCQAQRFTLWSTELNGSEDLRNVSFTGKNVIIIGSESHGVSKEVSASAQHSLLIPRFGKAESLNAALACGIILAKVRS